MHVLYYKWKSGLNLEHHSIGYISRWMAVKLKLDACEWDIVVNPDLV